MPNHNWATFLSKLLRGISKTTYYLEEADSQSLLGEQATTNAKKAKEELKTEETIPSQSNEETNNSTSSFIINNIIQAVDTADPIIEDNDKASLVDDSPHYQIIHNGQTIDLTDKKGRKISDGSNANWDAIKAVQSDSGYQVLLEGMGRKEGKFRIWQINENGTITSNSKWKTTAEALTAGWDSSFGDVFQGDDTADPIIDEDGNDDTPDPVLNDDDNDGLVDDSPHYQIIHNGDTIDLTDKKGRKMSDSSNANWDAIKAVQSDSGYQVLLEGMGRKEGMFRIWRINENGTITSNSKWKTTGQALTAGWDSRFGDVFQADDTIININDGNATFNIQGTPEVEEKLIVELIDNDPDGNGSFNYTWETSSDATNWSTIASGSSLTISPELEGQQVQARISYTDAEEHSENVYTDSVTIAYFDNGEASFKIEGTPEVGESLTAALVDNDPDGNGSFNYTWETSSDATNWSTIATGSSLIVSQELEGQQVQARISYTDAEKHSENVYTDSVTIAYFDNGEASFKIEGTPEVGESLTAALVDNDPDGNGSFGYTWETSSDATNWSTIATGSSLIVSQELEGQQVQARISYTDDEEHSENVYTNSVTIARSDDFSEDSGTKGRLSIGGSTTGELEEAGDSDWFQVSLIEGASYEFNQVGNSLSDPYLYLRGQNGTILLGNDDGGTGLNSRITFDATSTGAYYLDAGSYQNSLTGSYTVSATQTSAPPPLDGDDFGEDINTIGRLSIGGSTTGELEEPGDRDWFEISVTDGATYQVDLNGDTLSDPFLRLFDESGSLITSDDDSGLNLNSRITFVAQETESYFVEADSYGNNLVGSYIISATETAAPPEPGFSSIDGWGEVSASRAFEQLTGINLPSVDNLGGNLWGVDNVNAPEVWAGSPGFSGVTGEGVTVAVIDTGVDLDHPEFIGRLTAGYDFVDNDNTPDDGNGHGTHVAGTIAGDDNDGVGISGIAPDARIMPIRVLDNSGSGYTSDIIEGIIWATDEGADVVNLSLGGGGYSQAMADAIEYASNNGTVVVMAAGNSSGSSPDYPAAHAIDHGIAVGAVDQNRNMASFSNLAGNTVLDYVTAPGQSIYSSVPNGNYDQNGERDQNGKYDFLSGTSMATPHVAGIAALLKSHDNSLSASTIEGLITRTASNAPSTNITTTLSESPNSENSFSSETMITPETIHQFSEDQLSTRLIGRTKNSNEQPNKEFSRQINGFGQSNLTSDTQPFGAQTAGFLSVDLTDTSDAISRSELLSNLLSSNQFEYFEVDSIRTTTQYTNQAKDFESSSLEPKDELTGETLNLSILSTTNQSSSQTNAAIPNTFEKSQQDLPFDTSEIFQPVEDSTVSLNPSQFSNPSESLETDSLESKDELTGETLNPSIFSTTTHGSSQTNSVIINTIDNIKKTPTFNTIETFEVIEEAPSPLSPSQWTEPTDDNNSFIGAQPSEQIETLKTDISLGII